MCEREGKHPKTKGTSVWNVEGYHGRRKQTTFRLVWLEHRGMMALCVILAMRVGSELHRLNLMMAFVNAAYRRTLGCDKQEENMYHK